MSSKQITSFLIALIIFAWPASAQSVENFYDDSAIQDIHLSIHPTDWAKLQQNYLDNTYYPAEFKWRDIVLSDVGVRSRGRSSRSPIKPNIKIDFDRYEEKQKFLGLKSTTMKANNADASMMRERIAMVLFDRMGVPAPKETYARLYVNGLFFGLYNLIETVDKDFLRRVFNEDAGYLYEWKPKTEGYRFEFLGEDPAKYSPVLFDPITHEKDPDPQPLVSMVRAINESSDSDFLTAIAPFIDPAKFVKHIAVEAFLADYDGVLGEPTGMNNFHIYRFAGTTLHIFMAWDKDLTFIGQGREVMQEVEKNVLARRLLNLPEYRRLYFDSLLQAAELMGGEGGAMEEIINRLYAQVADVARQDPYKQCVIAGEVKACGPAEFERDVEYIRSFARTRAAEVKAQIAALSR